MVVFGFVIWVYRFIYVCFRISLNCFIYGSFKIYIDIIGIKNIFGCF